MKVNIITRLTRPEYIKEVWKSIEDSKVDNIQINWHVIIDILGNFSISSELLRFIESKTTSVIMEKGEPNTFGYSLINNLIDTLPDDEWIYILDDDNAMHPDFFKTVQERVNLPGIWAFDQLIEGKDFTKLHIREATIDNMRWQGVDVGQLLIHKGTMNPHRFHAHYSGDGYFINTIKAEKPEIFHFINETLTNYNYFQKKKINRKLPRILLIHDKDVELISNNPHYFECEELTVKRIEKYDESVVSEFNPDCIVSIGGDWEDYPDLANSSFDFKQRWLHFREYSPEIGEDAYQCAMAYILGRQSTQPLLSIITPIYNTGDKLRRTYNSIKAQTYTNWEWVIVDDSTDEYTTNLAKEIERDDSRVTVYRILPISGGIIGEAKYRAFMLSRGEILMEMDHDDELHPEANEYIVKAYNKYPDAGFYYSDCIEINEKHESLTYGPDGTWALGYGKYYDYHHNGRDYKSVDQPNINPLTIRHIVAVPNHFRAWRRDVYLSIGSHNRRLSIADDYELIVRTFLHTRMVHIPKPLYFQYYHGGNSQDDGNARADIQRRVRSISVFYNWDIRNRFRQLGIEDWAFVDSNWPWYESAKFGEEEKYVNYLLDINENVGECRSIS